MSSTTATRTRTRRTPVSVAPRRVHLTGRGCALVLLCLVLLLLAAFAVGRSASSQATQQVSGPAVATTHITVQQGDTLWSISRRVAPQRDPRDVVAQIRRLNHLPSAAVQAGSQLLLPALV